MHDAGAVNSTVREAGETDVETALDIERRAFARSDEAELVRALLTDPAAQPVLSLIASAGGGDVGHVLFTAAAIGAAGHAVRAAILAPLAVVPEAQGKGVGRALIDDGLHRLAAAGMDLVFVLGDPVYYRRYGFEPAEPHGLAAPRPIAEQDADAWMVLDLRGGVLGSVTGPVEVAAVLDRPELWRK
jgi:putative acetyltransferase